MPRGKSDFYAKRFMPACREMILPAGFCFFGMRMIKGALADKGAGKASNCLYDRFFEDKLIGKSA